MPVRRPVLALLFSALLLTVLYSLLEPGPAARAGDLPPAAAYREDFDRDGVCDMADVIALLIYQRANPGDPGGDYNGDGFPNVIDAVAMLIAIRNGDLTPETGPDSPEPPAGMTLVQVPGGTFLMGEENPANGPQHRVSVNSFSMSTREITNFQYASYLNAALAAREITATRSRVTGAAGKYKGRVYIELLVTSNSRNRCWISYDDGSFSVEPGKEHLPVVYVTWHGAVSFATFYGMYLPTEAQWEYAARCGSRQLEYGTDDGTISPAKANYGEQVGCPVRAGSYPANPLGLHDMSGNVCEWCRDWYDPVYYTVSPDHDPQGPESGWDRVDRGGSWATDVKLNRAAGRDFNGPNYRHDYLGFRVVGNGTGR